MNKNNAANSSVSPPKAAWVVFAPDWPTISTLMQM